MTTKKWLLERIAAGDFRLSIHALLRSDERFVSEAGIRNCGRTAGRVSHQVDRDTWKVVGKDEFGEKLTIVCAIRNGVLIVTVY